MSQCTTLNSQREAGIEDLDTLLDTSGNYNPGTQSPSHPPTPTNMSSAQPESAHIEPVDNSNSDETSSTTGHNIETNTLAKAIELPKTLHVHPPMQNQLLRSSRSLLG